MRITSGGHAVFAAGMIAVGILSLIKGNFVAFWLPGPKSTATHEVMIYLCAVISLASGVGVLWQRTAPSAVRALLALLLLWLLLLRVPAIFRTPALQDSWSGLAETTVMVAGAWLLSLRLAADGDQPRLSLATGDNGVRVARVLFGLALIPFGVAHFSYFKETAALVPGWLPGHVAWVYFTGGAFIAAGVAVLIGVGARLAAALATMQLGLFTLLVWAPIVATLAKDTYQWSETVDSLALTGGAWVVAESYRGKPWFGVVKGR